MKIVDELYFTLPKAMSQLHVSSLHTGCYPHWNTEMGDMPMMVRLCVLKKIFCKDCEDKGSANVFFHTP